MTTSLNIVQQALVLRALTFLKLILSSVVISSSLRTWENPINGMTYKFISNPVFSPKLQTLTSNHLLNMSTWMSKRDLRLTFPKLSSLYSYHPSLFLLQSPPFPKMATSPFPFLKLKTLQSTMTFLFLYSSYLINHCNLLLLTSKYIQNLTTFLYIYFYNPSQVIIIFSWIIVITSWMVLLTPALPDSHLRLFIKQPE